MNCRQEECADSNIHELLSFIDYQNDYEKYTRLNNPLTWKYNYNLNLIGYF